MKSEVVISFVNVKKSYGKKVILNNFNLDIKKGEFITVIGSSGSGKTTTLKLINGLLKADEGQVIVNGENIDIVDIIQLRRKIGYVIQDVGLFPHMTIGENISYVLDLQKCPKRKSLERVRELMKIVQLEEDMIDCYPSELSGGQKQRVGIARALASKPEILLMDEPFGAVDNITRVVLQKEIVRIQKMLNITIFFITHDIKEAFEIGDRIVIMNKGKIEQIGTAKHIKDGIKTSFVKELIGEYV